MLYLGSAAHSRLGPLTSLPVDQCTPIRMQGDDYQQPYGFQDTHLHSTVSAGHLYKALSAVRHFHSDIQSHAGNTDK